MKRAYALLDIRNTDDDRRVIEGIANTSDIDSYNTVLEPQGAVFRLPLPVLYQHNSRQPIGHVVDAKVSKDGIRVKIQVAKSGIAEFIDEAWALIKNGLVRGLSVGFDPIEEVFDKSFNGFRFPKWKWLELSTVTIPANAEATMSSVRSADEAILAALGTPGRSKVVRISSDPSRARDQRNDKTMDYAQQIKGYETTIAANYARLAAINEKITAEGRTKDESERQEFDELNDSIRSLEKEIEDAKAMQALQKRMVTEATPVTDKTTGTHQKASENRGGGSQPVRVRANLEPGTGFARYAIALFHAQGDHARAASIVESIRPWMDTTPEVAQALRAPVLPGTTTTSGWAAELSPLQNLASEFVEFLRPMTIIGKVQGFRRVPFNSLMPRQTAGTAGNWVGQGARKPVGVLGFDTVELKPLKVAKIVAITTELERFSNPAAVEVVRRDLAEGLQETIDKTFADFNVTATPNVSPASIFQGATNTASGGGEFLDVLKDLKTAIGHFTAQDMSSGGLVIVTTEDIATGLSLLPTALGVSAFPEMTTTGGTLRGIQVVTSSVVPTGMMGFFKPSEIFLADDGQAMIDISREASLFMDDGGSPSSTTVTSLWQENKVGVKAERFINWEKRRPNSTYYLTSVDYDGAA